MLHSLKRLAAIAAGSLPREADLRHTRERECQVVPCEGKADALLRAVGEGGQQFLAHNREGAGGLALSLAQEPQTVGRSPWQGLDVQAGMAGLRSAQPLADQGLTDLLFRSSSEMR